MMDPQNPAIRESRQMAGRMRVAQHEMLGQTIKKPLVQLSAGRARFVLSFSDKKQFMKTNSQSSGWKPDSALVRCLLSRPFHGGLPSNVPPVGGTDMSAICEFKAVPISICIEIAGAGAGG